MHAHGRHWLEIFKWDHISRDSTVWIMIQFTNLHPLAKTYQSNTTNKHGLELRPQADDKKGKLLIYLHIIF